MVQRTSNLGRPGIGNVGSYQVSGIPWITGSTITGSAEFHANFPFVASRVQVKVFDGGANDHIRVHFASINEGNVIDGNHWVHVSDGEPFEARVRCSDLYITHDRGQTIEFRVIAELTHIPASEMYELTGSGITD